MNYCVIDASGNVVNVIIWDGVSVYVPPVGTILIQSNAAGIGWTYANDVFTNPNQGEP